MECQAKKPVLSCEVQGPAGKNPNNLKKQKLHRMLYMTTCTIESCCLSINNRQVVSTVQDGKQKQGLSALTSVCHAVSMVPPMSAFQSVALELAAPSRVAGQSTACWQPTPGSSACVLSLQHVEDWHARAF